MLKVLRNSYACILYTCLPAEQTEPVFLQNASGEIVPCWPKMEKLLGLTRDDACSTPPRTQASTEADANNHCLFQLGCTWEEMSTVWYKIFIIRYLLDK